MFRLYVTKGWTRLWQKLFHNAVCFIMTIPNIVVKVEGEVSRPWPEYHNYFCNSNIYIGTAANICTTTGQWPSLTLNSKRELRTRVQYSEKLHFSLQFGLHWNLFIICSVLHTCEKVDFLQTTVDGEIIKNRRVISKWKSLQKLGVVSTVRSVTRGVHEMHIMLTSVLSM